MSGDFTDNTNQNRYEYKVGESVAFANYHKKDDTLYIDYVEAPPELRGTGAAGKLMDHIVETARAGKMKITPVCGYAAMWLTRHPEHDDLKA
ncbi:MAG TPA: GNAT family N-acetyltransferase [Alphaproteobacteria bacterium]